MKLAAGFSLLGLGFVLGFASSDWQVEPAEQVQTYDDTRVGERLKFKEMTPAEREQSTCYALAPRHETYSVVLNQGVTCITVIGAGK